MVGFTCTRKWTNFPEAKLKWETFKAQNISLSQSISCLGEKTHYMIDLELVSLQGKGDIGFVYLKSVLGFAVGEHWLLYCIVQLQHLAWGTSKLQCNWTDDVKCPMALYRCRRWLINNLPSWDTVCVCKIISEKWLKIYPVRWWELLFLKG